MTLPEDVFPVRLNALLGWPRATFNAAVRRLWQASTIEEFRSATEFVAEVATELTDCQLKVVRAEWAKIHKVFEKQLELKRMVRDVYN